MTIPAIKNETPPPLPPIRNQTPPSLKLPEVLKREPSLFINICADFDPQTMKNFLLTCKTVRQINSDFKKSYKTTYSKFLNQIFPHGFRQKSIEELSDEMIQLCRNTNDLCLDNHSLSTNRQEPVLSDEEITQYQKLQFLELKDLLNALKASGKFDKIDKDKLEEAFSSACMYTDPDMVELFIHSGRYHDISVDCLNEAFGLDAPRDDGSTIRTLIKSNRFHEISSKSLGDALCHASNNGHPGVVQAIMESGRADEISLETFSGALELAARNGESSYDNESKFKGLLILMRFPQFNKISPEDVGKALKGAASNYRGNSVQAIIKSNRFHEISREQLNKSFYWSMRNFEASSAYALIKSGRFSEITVDCLDKSLPLRSGQRDDGMVMEALVKTKQFEKISIESIGETLENTACNENPRALKAIIDSERFAEIPLQNFTRAVNRAAGLGFRNHIVPIENLKMLMNCAQFNQIHREDLGQIFLNAVYSETEETINTKYADRKDAIRLLLQSERFMEINISQVIEAVNKLIEKNDLESLRIFRDSGRFNEISSELQVSCNFKLDVPAHTE